MNSPDVPLPCFAPADLAVWTGGEWEHPPAGLRGVVHDSQRVARGCLFVAVRGGRRDGHDFVAAALAAGAAAAMVARDWPAPGPLPLLRVDDTRRALSAAGAGYRRALAPFVVGITGSVGKTTVKELTLALLAADRPAAGTRGNWNNDVGLPLSLLSMPAGTRAGAFEVGTNHPGEIAALCAVLQPDAAIVTGVGPVHIEFFGTVEAIAEEKADLVRAVPATGFAVLDGDAPRAEWMRRQARCRVLTVSLRAGAAADYTGADPDDAGGLVTVRERASGREARLSCARPGRHQALNLLLAVAAARAAGVSWERLPEGLARLGRLPMRWETVDLGAVRAINDAYNANPVSVRCALDTFARLPAPGGRVLVLGDMLELGDAAEAAHREVGRQVAAGPWRALLAVGPLAPWIADEARAAGFQGEIWRAANADAAGAVLARSLRSGETVLLKASRGVALERVLEPLRARFAAPPAPEGRA